MCSSLDSKSVGLSHSLLSTAKRLIHSICPANLNKTFLQTKLTTTSGAAASLSPYLTGRMSSSSSSTSWKAFLDSGPSVSKLKQWLTEQHVDYSACIEKSEFIALVRETGEKIDLAAGSVCDCSQPSSSSLHANPTSASSASATSSFSSSSESSSASASSSSSGYLHRCIPVGPLACNMSIVADTSQADRPAILCDPGGDAKQIIQLIDSLKVKIVLIVITHAHFDHFLAAFDVHSHTKAPIALHEDDKMLWSALPFQLSMLGMTQYISKLPSPVPAPHQYLKHEQSLPILNGKVYHTPGHSPGSCCFYFPPPVSLLLSGDTLFHQSVGRTDLMGGNSEQLIASIQNILYRLPENTKVIPGHNEETTIGFEMQNNMVVRAKKSSASTSSKSTKPDHDSDGSASKL